MIKSFAFSPGFILTIGYFIYRDGIESKLNYLYFERRWKYLRILVDTGSFDSLKVVYLSTFIGVVIAGITIAILHTNDAPRTLSIYSGTGILLGFLTYWWLHPDRTSSRFGGGTFFLIDISIGLAFIFIGFFIILVSDWLIREIR
jgi:hypothetical protein